MASQMSLIGCSLIIMVAMLKGATAERFVVGDSLGWTIPPNASFYSEWASSKTFEIGDQVVFNVTEGHSVAEVSTRAEYENCSKPGSIILGPNLFYEPNLTSSGSRFFICTVNDHCQRGMKVIVTVGSPTNTSASSTPNNSASSLSFGALFATFSAVVVSFLTYV